MNQEHNLGSYYYYYYYTHLPKKDQFPRILLQCTQVQSNYAYMIHAVQGLA